MNSSKTIIFTCGSISYGGAGKIVDYISGLFKEYFKQHVIIISFTENKLKTTNSSVEIISLNFKSHNFIDRIKTIISLRKIIKKYSPEFIYSFVSDKSVMTRIATLGLNVNFISAERGDPYTLPPIWKLLTSITYYLSDFCVFQTNEARDFFYKGIIKKSIVIHNPYFNKSQIIPYYGERKQTIVTAGRFAPEKGFELLIKAFANVHQLFPEYRLILYGSGKLYDEYLQLANSLNITDSIEFPGYIEDVAEAIREDGIFVLPSYYEGIPNVLLEAMSTGIPTVSANCSPGGPKLLTDNGRRGLLFKVGDIDELTSSLIELISNQSLRTELNAKGPEVTKVFDLEKIKTQWIELHIFLKNNYLRKQHKNEIE